MNSPILFEKQKIFIKDLAAKNPSINLVKPPNIKYAGERKNHINVLMLDYQNTYAIKGLLPHFSNTRSINVNIITCPQQNLLQRIIDESNDPDSEIDICMFDIPWLPYLASKKHLQDISDNMEAIGFSKDIFLPGCFKYYSEFENGLYGVPFIYVPQILFYRKDLFSNNSLRKDFERKYKIQLRPPRTWSEFNAIAEFFTMSFNIHSPLEYGTSVAAAYSELLAPEFFARLWSYNGRIFDEKNRVKFDTPEVQKAVNNFYKTFDFTHPSTIDHGIERTVQDFYKGRTAMLICYSSYTTEINDRFKSKIVGKIGYDHLPGRTPILGGWSLGICPNSKKKKIAFEFLNWVCSMDISSYFAIMQGQSPMVGLYSNNELIKMYPWLTLILDTYKYCRIRKGPYKEGSRVIPQNKLGSAITNSLYSILKYENSVTNAVSVAQRELEVLFESYGYHQK